MHQGAPGPMPAGPYPHYAQAPQRPMQYQTPGGMLRQTRQTRETLNTTPGGMLHQTSKTRKTRGTLTQTPGGMLHQTEDTTRRSHLRRAPQLFLTSKGFGLTMTMRLPKPMVALFRDSWL